MSDAVEVLWGLINSDPSERSTTAWRWAATDALEKLRATQSPTPPADDPRDQFRSGTHRWRG